MSLCMRCSTRPARYRVWWRTLRNRVTVDVCDQDYDEELRTASRYAAHGSSLIDQPPDEAQGALFDLEGGAA